MPTKILIADDSSNIRKIVKIDLESLGYQVYEAANGQEALEVIREHHPALVVLDVMMPRIDGFEVCFRMKEDPVLRDIAVIMLTVKTTMEDKYLGRKVGADKYLTKPFDPEELGEVIRHVLESRTRGEVDNPLTGLPMWQAVKNEIDIRRQRGDDFVVVKGCFEPETFDIFQKKYGNIKADEAIKSTGDLISSIIAGWPDIFLGHTGDDAFFFIATSTNLGKAREHIDRKLKETTPYFYNDHDRQAGGVALKQADGTTQKTGFMKWIWSVGDVE